MTARKSTQRKLIELMMLTAMARSADHPAMTARKSTQRKLIELMMLTAMARKNLGPYFWRRRRTGCHCTGRNILAFTGKNDLERLVAFLGEDRGTATSKVMVALLVFWASI
jgi:hypothetical protein